MIKEYVKIIMKNFVLSNIELETELVENQKEIREDFNEIENINNLKKEIYFINWLNLIYILGFFSLIGIGLYFYNNDIFNMNYDISKIGHLSELDSVGIILYKISSELSKSCTVKSWEIIHKVLKDLEKDSFNIFELIIELEKLRKYNILFPGDFSTNSDSFNKSLIKLINFLKEIL